MRDWNEESGEEGRRKIWNELQAFGLSDLREGFAPSDETRFIGFGRTGDEFGSR